MNVWKYIYIKFYEFRRWMLGKTLGEAYAAMLFVASFDVLLYFGVVIFLDGLTGSILYDNYRGLFYGILIGGVLLIEHLRKRSMCRQGVFERLKKEVEEEPQKLKWSILSILYMIFVVLFFLFCCYVGKYGLNF